MPRITSIDDPMPEVEPQEPKPGQYTSFDEMGDLRAWLQQFQYAPGLQYVRLSRVAPVRFKHPTTGDEISVTGELEQIDEPIDMDSLRDRWGGGTFVFTPVQLRGGVPRVVKPSAQVHLGGPPTAYLSADGWTPMVTDEEEDVPQPQGVGGRQASWNAWRMEQTRRNPEYGAPQYNSALHGANSPETLRVLQAQGQAAMEAVREANQAASEAGERANEQIRLIEAESRRPIEQAMATMRAQLDQQRAQHEVNLAGLQRAHEQQLEAMRREHEQHLRTMEAASARREEAAKAEMISLREDSRHREAMTTQQIQATYQGQVTNLQTALMEAQRSAQETVRRAEDRARDDLKALRDEYIRREEDLRREAARTEQQLRDMLPAGYMGEIAALKGDKERLERELTNAQAELRHVRELYDEKKDPLSALSEMHGLVKAFDDLRGGTPGQAEPEPESTIGKIAFHAQKVLPAVSQFVVEPMRQTAERAIGLEQQRLAQEQNERLRQQGMQQPYQPPQLPPPQQMMPMPQQPPQQPQPQPLPQQQMMPQPPQQPPQQPPMPQQQQPEEGGEGEEDLEDASEGELQDQLVTDLARRFDANEPVAEVAKALRAGMPPEIMSQIRQLDAQMVIGSLFETAQQLGHWDLASPRGREWLASVYNALKVLP